MSAVSAGNYHQPPRADPRRTPDDTSEPLGYDLTDGLGYQQPPPPLVRPAHAYALGPTLPSGYAWDPPSIAPSITGFVLSSAGLVFAMVDPRFIAPLALAGIAVNAIALVRCRVGRARGSVWAMAGLVLGAIDVVLVLSLMRLILAMLRPGDGPGP
jgi:hypothetical protein